MQKNPAREEGYWEGFRDNMDYVTAITIGVVLLALLGLGNHYNLFR